MNKILILSFFMIIGLYSSQVDAQRVIRLNPNETKSLSNNTLWPLSANCVVQSNRPSKSKIKIKMVKNSGVINGRKLTTGQGTFIQVSNNSSVSVRAESGTMINLINLGSDSLQAVCST